jgi:UDP-2,3-diacylglucosamine pyrophosphatase LpxH
MRISENTEPGFFPRLTGVLRNIARTFGLSERRSVIEPPKEPDSCAEQAAFSGRCIVFSDTDNCMNSLKKTLRFAGILDERDELTDNLDGISIFHTGDMIDKKNPDLSVVKYWQHLQQDALAKGCHVKLIVGNHEQEVWQKIMTGETYGMRAEQAHWLSEYIESLDLFHVAGSILFIHGYPTLEFLRALQHFQEVTGKDLNSFNADHYKRALISINAMRQYSYVRERRRTHYLLYDVVDASRYYKKQGRMVGAVLAKLKIDIVVHGHRPQRSGVQVDYEFGKWIPNVRMIGNDTMVRTRGIGATVIRVVPGGTVDIDFINKKTKSEKLRRKVRKNLREPLGSSGASGFTGAEDVEIKSSAQG